MTISMESNEESSSRGRAQHLFNKNVELENKRRKAAQARTPSNPNTWQQMRENYEAIILEDYSFSEQHDMEYALWQLHYRRIEELRTLLNRAVASAGSDGSRNGKASGHSGHDLVAKIRTQFKTFLSEATGFYHDLMLKIRAKYGLPLGYFSDDSNNQIPTTKDGIKALISCHRCLIYLGDLARYKGLYGEGDFVAASSYYMQALPLCPSNGNPHHQLAILAGYSNDELVSIYRYFRSLAVDNPFITARDNLIIAFEKNRQTFIQLLGDVKGSTVITAPSRMLGKGRGKGETRPRAQDIHLETDTERTPSNIDPLKSFSIRFVRLNGILFTRTSLETFSQVFSSVKSDLLELLSSGAEEDFNFGSDAAECRLAIVRMIAILIFTVHNVKRENENQSYADILQRSVLLQNAFTATFEFIGCMVERCSQLNDPSSSYLLPGIMVFVEWLASHPDVAIGSEMEEKQQNARSFFWKNCVALLNKLLSKGYIDVDEHEEEAFFPSISNYDETETANHLALSEDFELRGFIPLHPAQVILDFSRKHPFVGDVGNKEKIARVQRAVTAGKALTNVGQVGEGGIYFDAKLKQFIIGIEPQASDDHLPMVPILNGNLPEVSFGAHSGPVQIRKPDVNIGSEDEYDDEVIVFRPSINEKHVENLCTKGTSSKVPASVAGVGKFDLEKVNASFPMGHDNNLLQNTLNMGIRQPTVTADFTSPHLLPHNPVLSKWPGGHASVMNSFAHLNMMENGQSRKSEGTDEFGVSQSASFSMPYTNLLNVSAGHGSYAQIPQASVQAKYDTVMSVQAYAQIPQASVQAKYDTVMSIGATSEPLVAKPSSVMALGVKKNPVGRPVRHIGPPPGFGSVTSKAMDESLNSALKNASSLVPQMDDYRWLDGYHLSSSNLSNIVSNSFNQSGNVAPTLTKSNGSIAIANFPFPVKKLPVPNFQNGNLQTLSPQQQYQGQSLWENRFFE